MMIAIVLNPKDPLPGPPLKGEGAMGPSARMLVIGVPSPLKGGTGRGSSQLEPVQ